MIVKKHLFADIVLKFGFPRILHLDNGMEFKSKLIETLLQQLGIRKISISSCHLQANGRLESWNRFSKDCLEIFYRWCPWMVSITLIYKSYI